MVTTRTTWIQGQENTKGNGVIRYFHIPMDRLPAIGSQ
jgi:hypothetical protein